MNKQDFLARLREVLSGLPQEDIQERLAFYDEMIDDRMEDGLSEAEAVAEFGTADEIVAQILAETPLTRLVKERMKPAGRLQVWEIVLLVLGFPLWFSLLIAAFAVLLSVYIVIWAVILSLWAVELSVIVGALGGLAAGAFLLIRGSGAQGLLMISAGLVLAGLAIFLFYGCRAVTGGALRLTKTIILRVKSRFLRKENTK